MSETVFQWNVAARGIGNILQNIGVKVLGRKIMEGPRIENQKRIITLNVKIRTKYKQLKKGRNQIFQQTSFLYIWAFSINKVPYETLKRIHKSSSALNMFIEKKSGDFFFFCAENSSKLFSTSFNICDIMFMTT